jgi:hypothetical protein
MKTDNFKMELYENINNYFIINNISKYANSKMYYKLFIAICWWLLSLFLLLFVPANKFFYSICFSLFCTTLYSFECSP